MSSFYPQSEIFAGLTLVTGPTDEPVNLADAKQHLRVHPSFTDDDPYILECIQTARRKCEEIQRRAYLTQTWRLSLKSWPGRDYQNWPTALTADGDNYYKFNHIKLPLPPLQSVTSVVYTDLTGTPFTMPQGLPGGSAQVSGGYNVFTDFEPGRIVLPYSQIWPSEILLPGAPIAITFVAGYADLPTLQASFEGYVMVSRAIKLLAGYWYEHRAPGNEQRQFGLSSEMEEMVSELLEGSKSWGYE